MSVFPPCVCVCVCARVCMSERTAQAVTYTAAETTEGGGGVWSRPNKDMGGGTWCCSDWFWPLHTRVLTHTHTHTHTHTGSDTHSHTHTNNLCIHLPLPTPVKGRMRGEGANMLPSPPPLQQWTAPCAADWSDRSKESAYMCGKKKKTQDQNTPANQYSAGMKLVFLSHMKGR